MSDQLVVTLTYSRISQNAPKMPKGGCFQIPLRAGSKRKTKPDVEQCPKLIKIDQVIIGEHYYEGIQVSFFLKILE